MELPAQVRLLALAVAHLEVHVPVPAGEHVVAMRFQPASLRNGLLVTVAAAVGLLTLLLAGLLRRRGRQMSAV